MAVATGRAASSKPPLRAGRLTIVEGPGRGIAAAINTGIREARYPLICQIDQDVLLDAGWLAAVLDALNDPAVAAAQGHYQTPTDGGLWARVMGRDLEQRYRRMRGSDGITYAPAIPRTGPARSTRSGCSTSRSAMARQRSQLSVEGRRPSARVLSNRDQRSPLARGLLGLPSPAVRCWLRAPGVALPTPTAFGGDDVSGALMMAHGPLMLVAWWRMSQPFSRRQQDVRGSVATAAASLLLTLFRGTFLRRSRAHGGIPAIARPRVRRGASAPRYRLGRGHRRLADPPDSTHTVSRRVTAWRESGVAAGHGDLPHASRLLALIPAFNEALNLHASRPRAAPLRASAHYPGC